MRKIRITEGGGCFVSEAFNPIFARFKSDIECCLTRTHSSVFTKRKSKFKHSLENSWCKEVDGAVPNINTRLESSLLNILCTAIFDQLFSPSLWYSNIPQKPLISYLDLSSCLRCMRDCARLLGEVVYISIFPKFSFSRLQYRMKI